MSRVSLPVYTITITRMRDVTVLTIATMAAAFVVCAVFTDSEEETPRQRLAEQKRRQERGAFEGIFKELRAEELSFKKFVSIDYATFKSSCLFFVTNKNKEDHQNACRASPSVVVYSRVGPRLNLRSRC